jgi:hypothetical protein
MVVLGDPLIKTYLFCREKRLTAKNFIYFFYLLTLGGGINSFQDVACYLAAAEWHQDTHTRHQRLIARIRSQVCQGPVDRCRNSHCKIVFYGIICHARVTLLLLVAIAGAITGLKDFLIPL